MDRISRTQWQDLARDLLTSARPHFHPSHARLVVPGPEGASGLDSDGLEGYARTLMLAGFLLAGRLADWRESNPQAATPTDAEIASIDPDGFARWYRQGLIAGTDPHHADAWPSLPECKQARVEAAAIALILDMTRPLIWDRLTPAQRDLVLDWLEPATEVDYIPGNWQWFRVITLTFLNHEGRSVDPGAVADALACIDSFYRGEGWYTDGARRSFDHYIGWAMHFYPTLWARMAGAEQFAPERIASDRERLARFLPDALALVGGQGQPLFYGRSLTYRFATIAPLWTAVIAGVGEPYLGAIKACADATITHFYQHGAPDAQGLLNLGWHQRWEPIRQLYSGSSSAYWAAKGMVGLMLPASHPIWDVAAQPVPAAAADELRLIAPPNWIVSTTSADGIVRLYNHGGDCGFPGQGGPESPLYGRVAYSTHTAPGLDAQSYANPFDNAAVLLDAQGRASHRTGFIPGGAGISDGVAWACAGGVVNWVESRPLTLVNALGLEGDAEPAGSVDIVSLVRGGWEVRLVRVRDPRPEAVALRIGGWAITADEVIENASDSSVLLSSELICSQLVTLSEAGKLLVSARAEASPLAGETKIPAVQLAVKPGQWQAVGVGLHGRDSNIEPPSLHAMDVTQGNVVVSIEWGDGAVTTTTVSIQSVDAEHDPRVTNLVPQGHRH